MLNYVIWTAARNACMDLWSRIRTCSGKSFGLLWLLVLPTAGKSWKMSTIQVILNEDHRPSFFQNSCTGNTFEEEITVGEIPENVDRVDSGDF